MKPTELKRLLSDVHHLTADECFEVKAALQRREQRVLSSILIKEAERAVKACPHCGCETLASAGSKDGRKRFKCKACVKTFNAFTGTPLARLHMAEKHIENADCLIEGMSIRKTAAKLKVNIKTAFLWRHRFLQGSRSAQPKLLSGVVEADETFFLESFKGQRKNLPRPAKTRGMPATQRGLSNEQIPVLVARDRSNGATLTLRLKNRSSKEIGGKLLPFLDRDVVLCSDGASAYRTMGKKHGIDVKSVPAKKSPGNYHINNVNAYDSRLKGWMFRFKGVATKYLDSYLGWHRVLDHSKHSPSAQAFVADSLAFH